MRGVGHRGGVFHPEALEAPEKDTQFGDVVPAGSTTALPEIRGMKKLIESGRGPDGGLASTERRLSLEGAVHVSQIGPATDAGVGPTSDEPFGQLQSAVASGIVCARGEADLRIEAVARPSQAAEELNNAGVPTGDIGGDFFKDSNGATAAAIVDGLRNIESLAARVLAGHQARGEEIGNIGDDPVVTSLNGLVFPQPVDATAQDCGLCSDAIDHLAQRAVDAKLGRVLAAVDGGQQVPELVRVVNLVVINRHGAPPPVRS